MFGSEILEVAIGLIFIFLIISLIASAVRELIESLLKSRAVHLERGIRQLLDDPDGTQVTKELFDHPLLFGLFAGEYDPETHLTPFRLGRTKRTVTGPEGAPVETKALRLKLGSNLPAYIPSRNFAMALLDLVGGGGKSGEAINLDTIRANAMALPEGRVRQAVLVSIGEAAGSIDRARASLEAWFDSNMDRVSGWYKRETQWILLGLGALVAVTLNVDAIGAARELASNPAERQVVMAQVEAFRAAGGDTATLPQLSNDELKRAAQGLSNVIGWGADTDGVDLLQILGWLITALAVSLGAPFWFDLLNKFMVIRSTVKPYEKSPPEGSEDRRGPMSGAERLAPVPGSGPGAGGGLVSPGFSGSDGGGLSESAALGDGSGGGEAGGRPIARYRLAVDTSGIRPGTLRLVKDGEEVAVPEDGLVELPMEAEAWHDLEATAEREDGTTARWTERVYTTVDDEAQPIMAEFGAAEGGR